jgi:hypothetical protein
MKNIINKSNVLTMSMYKILIWNKINKTVYVEKIIKFL